MFVKTKLVFGAAQALHQKQIMGFQPDMILVKDAELNKTGNFIFESVAHPRFQK